MINSVNEIKSKTEQLGQTVEQLSGSTAEIGSLLLVINEIADQTNLLALNAAIEAARAGDAGRGFAVVADEVRKLAERVQQATQQISDIVSILQKDSKSVSSDMQDAVFSVSKGIENITKTTELFEAVVASVNNIDAATRSVSNSIYSQSSMIGEVNENTQSLAAGIEESATAVNEISGTVHHLQSLAQQLRQQVEIFKV